MKKVKTITDKETLKGIAKVSGWSTDDFSAHACRYIKAIKEGRMICNIDTVSSSGMSRTIKFMECQKNRTGRYAYYQFWALFKALGYSATSSNRDTFRINGCGMDMIFHTNYSIIHRLQRLGFLTKKECAHLAQQTPTVI